MKTLYESILDDVEVSLSKGIEDIYPVPTKKDFVTRQGATGICWYCKDFIQKYIRTIRLRSVMKTRLDEVDNICIFMRGYDDIVATQLCIGKNPYITLQGVGLNITKGLSNEKDTIIKLFNILAHDPDKFKDLFEIHNEFERKWDKGEVNYLNLDEVVKILEKSK